MILATMNLVFCSVILFICFDRVRMTSRNTAWPVRWGLALLGAGAAGWAGAAIFLPDVVPFVRIVLSAGILIHLLAESPSWKHGAPRELHYGTERRLGTDRRTSPRGECQERRNQS